MLWLGILLVFYHTVFAQTTVVAGWTEAEYLFFVGCYFALDGLIETLFLENCNEFADLVRTGDLDFYLLKPIDEQFLITCRSIDWSTAPNVVMGAGVMVGSLVPDGLARSTSCRVLAFLVHVRLRGGDRLQLPADADRRSSVWLVRNQSLMEMWWLFTSLMRYPRRSSRGTWAEPSGWFFTFVVPILLVVNVPANAMVRVLEPEMIAFTLAATAVLVWASRRFFQHALRSYRSASS